MLGGVQRATKVFGSVVSRRCNDLAELDVLHLYAMPSVPKAVYQMSGRGQEWNEDSPCPQGHPVHCKR